MAKQGEIECLEPMHGDSLAGGGEMETHLRQEGNIQRLTSKHAALRWKLNVER